MSTSARRAGRSAQSGISFIELIMFIVIVSVGMVGILSVMNLTTSRSADPLIQKQALAIAESLMEEIRLQPFTYCDPNDENASAADDAGACSIEETLGAEAGEARVSATDRFDNVNDYAGLVMTGGIVDLVSGATINGLGDYNASVAIAEEAIGGVPSADSLRIDVTVTHPRSGTSITLTGYRMRYAPRST